MKKINSLKIMKSFFLVGETKVYVPYLALLIPIKSIWHATRSDIFSCPRDFSFCVEQRALREEKVLAQPFSLQEVLDYNFNLLTLLWDVCLPSSS
jgi:hypothetical protein